jgi:hypothetical protein
MGFGREIEQLRRRANKAAIHVRVPELKIITLKENDPEPEESDMWSLVVRIDGHKDYYPSGSEPPLPIQGTEDP